MMALLFLITSFYGGLTVADYIFTKKRNIWCKIAASIGIGYLLSGWIVYLVSYISTVWLHLSYPKMHGNIAAIVLMSILGAQERKHRQQKQLYTPVHTEKRSLTDRNGSQGRYTIGNTDYATESCARSSIKESVCFCLLFLFILLSMFYVFRVKSSYLESGVSVFSDYAPHTAMIRSFSWHNNFPTQYPYYGGTDVKYHFMFQFFAGNLEFLGMRIDWAFNLISTASLWGFLVLLYYFAEDITGKKLAGAFTLIFFFCRSSFAGVMKLFQTIMDGNWSSFWNNTEFIGYTTHEDWGLWNYNVFLNQRHLGFGLLISVLVMMFFADNLNYDKDKHILPYHRTACLMGCLLGGLAFWNGAVVIATLLILFVFAIFSKNKLDYFITAIITLTLSVLQKIWFMNQSAGNNMKLRFQFGFLADNPTLSGVCAYLVLLYGIFFLGVLFALFVFRGKKRVLIIAFLSPIIFAFTISMTPDIAVNHKYIMISNIFLNIIWADMLAWLFQKKWNHITIKSISVLVGSVLFFLLTITGAYDLLTIYNKNKQTVCIDMHSQLTVWLKNNLSEKDLILTGEDSMSDITLSGVMLYNGWPYYAWSAGYDTDTRAKNAKIIYTTTNKKELKELVREENITYIFYRDEMTYEGDSCTDETISQIYPCVYQDENAKIYQVQKHETYELQ